MAMKMAAAHKMNYGAGPSLLPPPAQLAEPVQPNPPAQQSLTPEMNKGNEVVHPNIVITWSNNKIGSLYVTVKLYKNK